jgi:hypothetical protein
MTPRTVVCRLGGGRRGCNQRSLRPAPSTSARPALPRGRVPRVSRLLALAFRLEELVRGGVVADYATLAELAHVFVSISPCLSGRTGQWLHFPQRIRPERLPSRAQL